MSAAIKGHANTPIRRSMVESVINNLFDMLLCPLIWNIVAKNVQFKVIVITAIMHANDAWVRYSERADGEKIAFTSVLHKVGTLSCIVMFDILGIF